MEKIVTHVWVIFREGETGRLSIQRVFGGGDYAKAAEELIELSASIEARYFLLQVAVAREIQEE